MQVHYSQQKIQDLLIPQLQEKGELFIKYRCVLARHAREGEQIVTITGDGKETANKANSGDYVVKNTTKAKERYIVPGSKFHKKYVLQKKRKGKKYDRYQPVGKVLGILVTDKVLPELAREKEVYFEAPWGEPMVIKTGDYMVCPPDLSEVYRIARQEFFETYREVEKT